MIVESLRSVPNVVITKKIVIRAAYLFAKKLSVRVLSFPIKCLSGAINKEIKPFGIESAF